jgi:hypothetical protein
VDRNAALLREAVDAAKAYLVCAVTALWHHSHTWPDGLMFVTHRRNASRRRSPPASPRWRLLRRLRQRPTGARVPICVRR